jgi:hypothetical protein
MMLTFALTVLASVSRPAGLIAATVGRSTGLGGLRPLASSVAIWFTAVRGRAARLAAEVHRLVYLGYSAATAFSTTDVAPLTARAKLLMILQSAIPLVTVLVVAARAINVLGN